MTLKWLAILLVSATCLHTCLSQHQGARGYFGCFRDKEALNRDLKQMVYESHADNNVDLCRDACHKQKFRFAGLQQGSQCFCSNSYGRHGKADNCNLPCPGKKRQICGGARANSVYFANIEGPRFYFGCFRDGPNPDLGRLAFTSVDAMSIPKCTTACFKLKAKYAGVQNGTQCYCGNSFGDYGSSSKCEVKCSGQPARMCGGRKSNDVFLSADLSSRSSGSAIDEDEDEELEEDFEFEERR